MKVVKSLIFILFALCSLSGKAQEVAADSTGYIVRVGEMAPNFTITLTDGKKVTLSELRGKVVMLQFTASWCGVCRKEMPFIEKDIWLKHKDNSAFALIGIDRDEPLDKVIAFGKSTGVTYPLGLDPHTQHPAYVQNPNPAIQPVLPALLPHFPMPSPRCSLHPSSLRYH